MSLLKKLVRGAGKIIGKAASFVPGPIGTIAKIGTGLAAGVGASRKMAGPVMAGLPAIRSLPGAGAVGGAVRVGGKIAGAAATGAILYDAAGNIIGQRKRSKRINPLNHKALTRALRRVCSAKNLADRLNAIDIKTKAKRKRYAC